MDEQEELVQATETKKEKRRYGPIAIGCGIFLLLSICGCVVFGAATIGLFSYWGSEPEGLGLQAQYPWTVQLDERFELILTLNNSGNGSITIDSIDLDESLSGSILDGAIVERTEPEMDKDYSIPGIKSFFYKETLAPGESQEMTFYLRATEKGDHGGTIGVYVGGQATRQDVSISVLP